MEESIHKLIEGFRNFHNNWFAGDSELFEKLRHGQHPRVCVLSCSDSRVDPAILLESDPGDLFVIRNVANLVPPYEPDARHHGVSAALEYAVSELNIGHLILLGHSDCGGIKALMQRTPEHPAGQFLDPWLNLAEPAKQAVNASMTESPEATRCRACEEASLVLGLENLLTFPWIRSRTDTGELTLHAWYFHMPTGQLFRFDRDRNGFFRLDDSLLHPTGENQ
ncbi:MAG: carbonic anhydrase [Lentisphaeria bacterium]|nr:carbonic anhydrase [Lentisphaeria bacterium]